MKSVRRIISLALAAVLMLSVPTPAFTALADENSYITIARFSPLGAGSMRPLASTLNPNAPSSSYTLSGNTYYTEGSALYRQLRDNAEARNERFSIHLAFGSKQSTSSLSEKLYDYLVAATSQELASSSTHGDYIYWHMSAYGFNSAYVGKSGSKHCYDVEVRLAYRDTASEEKEVDKVVSGYVTSVNTGSMTDYEIIKSVHDFICKRATYDYAAMNAMNTFMSGNYDYAFTSYGALVKGKTVCQGYALAFYRICRELGYNVRFVSSDPNEGCHAWNIIELNSRFYFVDCTWDDEQGNYDYFLVDYDDIRKDDSSSQQHKLDKAIYNTDYFKTNYSSKFAIGDYDRYNTSLLSNCKMSLSYKSCTYDGYAKTPSASIRDAYGSTLTSDSYTTSYSSNVGSGMARVTANGVGSYAGSSTSRTFRISPAYVSGFATKSGTKAPDSITLKWSKTKSGATGYYIYRYESGSWKKIATVSADKTTYKDKKLSPSRTYKYRITEYKSIDRRIYLGAGYTMLETATTPKRPSITLTTAGGKINVKWKKVKCSGYTIQYSTKKDMSGAKTISASSSATSVKLKKLKKGKRYYVRVKASYKRKANSGKTYTYSSAYSPVKSIKA